MKFKQIGPISEKQKKGVKQSEEFKRFLRAAKSKGSKLITIFTEISAGETYVHLYAKNDLHDCHYWAEVGVRGGLVGEKVAV